MSKTIDIGAVRMLLVYALALVPLAVMVRFQMREMVRETLISLVRMTVQLGLVGLYLSEIFTRNNPWLSGLWIAVMVLVANHAVLGRAGVVKRRFFGVTLTAISLSTATVAGFMVFAVIRPEPLYDARYLVPITGMILGNCLRGNTLSLERFYSEIRSRRREFVTYLMLGATLSEAARPYMRTSLKAAVGPLLSTMATLGIVSLPGMMTGQILGGSIPLTAVKYQVAIMVCIATAITLSAMLNMLLSMRVAFDEYDMLRDDVFVG